MGRESTEKRIVGRLEGEEEKWKKAENALNFFLERHKSRFDKRRSREKYIEAFWEAWKRYELPVDPDKMASKKKFGSEEVEIELETGKKNISVYIKDRIEGLFNEGVTDFVQIAKRLSSGPHSREIMKYLVAKHLSPYEFFEQYFPHHWRVEKGKLLSIIDRLEYMAVARELRETKEKESQEKK